MEVRIEQVKVLPMFAALEQMHLQLCIDLSFTEE